MGEREREKHRAREREREKKKGEREISSEQRERERKKERERDREREKKEKEKEKEKEIDRFISLYIYIQIHSQYNVPIISVIPFARVLRQQIVKRQFASQRSFVTQFFVTCSFLQSFCKSYSNGLSIIKQAFFHSFSLFRFSRTFTAKWSI